MDTTFVEALEARTQEVLDRCTRCGGCFEVCPMTAPAGIAESNAVDTVSGVLRIINGDSGPAQAERWAQVCSGSGSCIPRCKDGVNPRFMLTLARLAMQRRATSEEQHSKGANAFAAMGRGVRILSRMQLAPEVLARFRTEASANPQVVFYTGCNVLKTPHIVLLCLDILDALGVSYQVMGGPGDCCGVLQFRTGDLDASGRVAYRTTDRFAATGAAKVLSWCPTCQVQIGENVLPGRRTESAGALSYELEAFVIYVASQLDRLKPLLRHRVEKRVGLHEHPGVAGVTEAAVSLLRAIPGLDFVDLEQPRVGWMCNTLQPLPAYKRDVHRSVLEAAAQAGVTTLAGVYHACHRELCSHETEWPFEVVNFLELIGESMGISREDHFKRLKKMNDANAVIADVMDLIEKHGLRLDEVRDVIERDLLGEQSLPLRPSAITPCNRDASA
jgi:heterodisulfide reductase subunit D